ncbi:hypothetical protein CHUAL_013566 [Chamberlinius hualienensis]
MIGSLKLRPLQSNTHVPSPAISSYDLKTSQQQHQTYIRQIITSQQTLQRKKNQLSVKMLSQRLKCPL